MTTRTRERVKFRLIHTPCCGTLLCWVNPRLPTFCPECGEKHLFAQLNRDPSRILLSDESAWLEYNTEA